ncbi:tumor necrosis factor receptor type 1-associated DEATH domain protein [Rhinatrema bivittatum]|uniref:tumor necrosis factor receptor type 1-associated DEATH domain protein n=1 Tax=Rhinatrema bivittatum TaxID=194408 RepID=UPI001128324D|nr:tumor necrosis factor receptor type 1-associated DEATH domain protein [Rhinatrema bivittatum]XP_029464551.1 tumor necrosis factor receptor type 1-associated DEATH domain protein [Rhinatrema bivittatum]
MAASAGAWTGSAFLFVQSTSEKINLSSLYKDSQQKHGVFKALKLALEGSATSGAHSVEILKVYCSEPQLIVYLKFCYEEPCRKFLQCYQNGVFRQSLQNQLQIALSMLSVPVKLELKVGSEQLDDILDDEDSCIRCINKEKPDRMKDEEIKDLEEGLRNLTCQNGTALGKNNSFPSLPLPPDSHRNSLPQNDTFLFQAQEFVNRPLTPEDHQKFARSVGRKWKQVGRTLKKTCRALQDPAIDNLAYEHEKDGLYEQAYQLLLKFIQSEGKKATLQRLVTALEENGLTGLAEQLLGIHQNEMFL